MFGFRRQWRLMESADDGKGGGISGQHPAAGSGSDDGGSDGDGKAGSGDGGSSGDNSGGDAGDSGDGGDSNGAGLLESHAAKNNAKEGEGGTESGDKGKPTDGRPEYLPEQYWDAEKGEVRVESMAKSLNDTRQALKEAKESKGFKAPDEYAITTPEGWKGGELEGDELVTAFQARAKAIGLPQKEFNEFFNGMLEDLGKMTEESEVLSALNEPVDLEAEVAKLGKNGNAVMDAVINWGNLLRDSGVLNEAEYKEILINGSTAEGISALNKIREHYGEKPIPLTPQGLDSGLPSKEELYAMTGTKLYKTNSDERKRVDDLFEKVFGTNPSGTSGKGIGVGG